MPDISNVTSLLISALSDLQRSSYALIIHVLFITLCNELSRHQYISSGGAYLSFFFSLRTPEDVTVSKETLMFALGRCEVTWNPFFKLIMLLGMSDIKD